REASISGHRRQLDLYRNRRPDGLVAAAFPGQTASATDLQSARPFDAAAVPAPADLTSSGGGCAHPKISLASAPLPGLASGECGWAGLFHHFSWRAVGLRRVSANPFGG